jgi:RNA polymerase sigma-B factor
MAVMEVAFDAENRRAPERARVRRPRPSRRRAHGPRRFPPSLPPRTEAPSRHVEPATCTSSRVAARALLHAYHGRGDLQARERLIQQYMPLVRSLAKRHAGRGEQLEDLVQVGSIGLINAVDRFQLDRGVDLSAYAIPSIVGEMKRHLRDRARPIRIPRRLQELNASLGRCAAKLAAELERPATVDEMAREAGVGHDEAVEALAAVSSHQPVSLSAGANGDRPEGGLEWTGEIEEGYEVGEDRAVLARGFRALDQRERRLLHLAFFKGWSQAQIAREVGISQIHVSRLTRRALEKLRAEIGPS